jgi:hypothetical protein
MATYKVIQDIEAEDKLVGPLSLKQFIFALIAIFLGFLMFKLAVSNVLGFTRWIFMSFLVLPTLLFAVLAAPLGGEQSTELWLLARIRFLLKPRRRVWNQTGPKQLVTITVPKKIERHLTKGFSQDETRSRLGALANVMDSRGWAVKNVNVNLNMMNDDIYTSSDSDSDRLAPAIPVPTQVGMADITAADDILDENNNETAQNLGKMVQESDREHRDLLQEQINRARADKQTAAQPDPNVPESVDLWFESRGADSKRSQTPAADSDFATPPPVNYVAGGSGQTIVPGTSAKETSVNYTDESSGQAEEALLEKVREKQANQRHANSFGHLKRLTPIEEKEEATRQLAEKNEEVEIDELKAKAVSPTRPDTGIINMSKDNDTYVDALARKAKKEISEKGNAGEIVFRIDH